MFLITAETAEEYLRSQRRIAPTAEVAVRRLAGGVSNEVLRIDVAGETGFVLKQARRQLRVPEEWFSRLERIWREVDVLRICRRMIDAAKGPLAATVPEVLFEDRENYAFAMTAAPADHQVWKTRLLAGDADAAIAAACGALLGCLHAGTWHDASVAAELDDREIFDELRIAPYYRKIAEVHTDLQPAIDRLIDRLWSERHALVHADFSPKNLLVYEGGLMMVDFETGHYGDPAFDLGFFLSHLMLKACYHQPDDEPLLALTESFWQAYLPAIAPVVPDEERAALIARAILNFAGCALARIDGKSQIDYLDDPTRRQRVRHLCRTLFLAEPDSWTAVLAEYRRSRDDALNDSGRD